MSSAERWREVEPRDLAEQKAKAHPTMMFEMMEETRKELSKD